MGLSKAMQLPSMGLTSLLPSKCMCRYSQALDDLIQHIRSRICRLALLSRLIQVQGNRDTEETYSHLKHASTEYQAAKRVLRSQEGSPARAWLVSDPSLQAFNSRGIRSEQ